MHGPWLTYAAERTAGAAAKPKRTTIEYCRVNDDDDLARGQRGRRKKNGPTANR
jgi:hypothetical protein